MTEQELIKYHTAREIWKVRAERTPSGKYTWAEWFKIKFGGEDLTEYAQKMAKQKEQDDGS